MLAYNCSPSFNWKKNLDDATIARFQRELGAMGYKFQFITLAGFHSLNYSMFNLAHGYANNNMSAFVELQEAEFAAAEKGFTAVRHQREVGTGYFDAVTTTVQGSQSSTTALEPLDRGRAVLRQEEGRVARRQRLAPDLFHRLSKKTPRGDSARRFFSACTNARSSALAGVSANPRGCAWSEAYEHFRHAVRPGRFERRDNDPRVLRVGARRTRSASSS